MGGSDLRRLLCTVLVTEPDWRSDRLESLDVGRRANAARRPLVAEGSPADVGWLTDHLDDASRYVVTAEVF
jgi:hypothetical protein